MAKTLQELVELARQREPRPAAVILPRDPALLLAIDEASRLGLIAPLVLTTRQLQSQLETNPALQTFPQRTVGDRVTAIQQAFDLAKSGEVALIVQGEVEMAALLRAAVAPKTGIRATKLLSQIMAFEIANYDRLILLTDTGVVVEPSLDQKVRITQNAIAVAHALGLSKPRVAVVSAAETVSSAMPSTMDAANLAKMAERGQITGACVDGPLALDNAISTEAARMKKIGGEVAGRADVLVVPDVEAGNLLARGMCFFAGGRYASVVVGGLVPMVVSVRPEECEDNVASIALATLLSADLP